MTAGDAEASKGATSTGRASTGVAAGQSGAQQADPAAPDAAGVAQRIRDSFARQGLMRHLGAHVVHIEPGEVRLRLPFASQLTQQHGFFHAGATSAIADTAGGYAGLSVFPPDSTVLTVEFKINLVAPAKGDALEAVGTVVRSGRTLTVCDLKVYALDGEARVLVALGQQTLICLHNTPDD